MDQRLTNLKHDSSKGFGNFFEATLADTIGNLGNNEPSECPLSGAGGVLPKSEIPEPKKETPQQKRTRRIMANRKSAKESRDRRRELVASLATKARVLSAHNDELVEANSKLRDEMRELKAQVKAVSALNAARQERQAALQLLQQRPPDLGLTMPGNALNISALRRSTQHSGLRLDPLGVGLQLRDVGGAPSLWEIRSKLERLKKKTDYEGHPLL